MVWRYFNEGNANILFISQDEKTLLRLAKKTSYTTSSETYHNLSVFAIFSRYFPVIQLVGFKEEWLALAENVKWDQSALIIENILYGTSLRISISDHIYVNSDTQKHKVILEFKPKWLYRCQTRNCRNCSLRSLRGKNDILCPLNLLSKHSISRWCETILKPVPELEWAIEKLSRSLQKDEIISLLYQEQDEQNFHATLLDLNSEEDANIELRKRMTLRDVTLFVKVNRFNDEYEIKIIDLDLKPREKFSYWKETELKLQDLYEKDLGLNCFKQFN